MSHTNRGGVGSKRPGFTESLHCNCSSILLLTLELGSKPCELAMDNMYVHICIKTLCVCVCVCVCLLKSTSSTQSFPSILIPF